MLLDGEASVAVELLGEGGDADAAADVREPAEGQDEPAQIVSAADVIDEDIRRLIYDAIAGMFGLTLLITPVAVADMTTVESLSSMVAGTFFLAWCSRAIKRVMICVNQDGGYRFLEEQDREQRLRQLQRGNRARELGGGAIIAALALVSVFTTKEPNAGLAFSIATIFAAIALKGAKGLVCEPERANPRAP